MKWLAEHKLHVLGFAVSAAYWPGMGSAAVIPRWGVIAVGLPLVSTMDPRGIPESLRWTLMFLLSVAALATGLASPDIWGGTMEFICIVLLCLIFIAAAQTDSIDGMMKGIGAGLALSSVLAITQYTDIWSPLVQSTIKPTGLFYNSEILAEFAALVLVWAIARPIWWMAAVAAVPLAFCQSRVALVIATMGVLFAVWPRRWVYRIAIVVGFATIAFWLLFALGFEKMNSADQRLILWTTTIASWTQFGHGLGWFAAAHPAEEFSHSDVLQAIAELGIGGFALVAIPFVAFRNSRGHHHAERALFVAVCVEAAISFPLHFPASGFLAAVVAGFLARVRGPVRMGQHQRGSEDAVDLQWNEPHGAGDLEPCGFGGRAISVRSVYPREATLHSEADRRDTGAARLIPFEFSTQQHHEIQLGGNA